MDCTRALDLTGMSRMQHVMKGVALRGLGTAPPTEQVWISLEH